MGLVEQSVAITFVLLLLWGALWFLKRRGGMGRLRAAPVSRELQLLERLPLTPNHALHLVRFRERDILVAVHPGGVTLISDMGGRSHATV